MFWPLHPWVVVAGTSREGGEVVPTFQWQKCPSAASKVCKAGITVRKNKYMLGVNALIIFMIGFALDYSAKETLFCQSQLNGCFSPKAQQ